MTDSSSGLNFIIVGASIAGLASAIGLKEAGHSVLVLEKESQLGGTSPIPSGCARVPPNGNKILADWGLDIVTNATIMDGFTVYRYDGGKAPNRDFIGMHRWNEELLKDARGNFIHFRHHDLLRVLFDAAVTPSKHNNDHFKNEDVDSVPHVSVVFGAEVVALDCDACSVTLRSGEVHTGDAIIGADGTGGVVRRALMQEEGAVENDVVPSLALYTATISKAAARKDQELSSFYDYPEGGISIGSNRGAMTVTGKDKDITFGVYTPDHFENGTWTEQAERKLTDVLGPCDEQLRKLASLAGPATCHPIRDHYELESWVSESGKVLVLGEAAHPIPPASIHSHSIAIEDGAFLGKIFSHTRSKDRISEFLYAFQEHREPRCVRIREMEKQYIYEMLTLPDGDMQGQRDAAMRANHAAGRNVGDAPDTDLQQLSDDTRMVFGYDACDDADEWWVSFGRYRGSLEVPKGQQENQITWMSFSSVDVDDADLKS